MKAIRQGRLGRGAEEGRAELQALARQRQQASSAREPEEPGSTAGHSMAASGPLQQSGRIAACGSPAATSHHPEHAG